MQSFFSENCRDENQYCNPIYSIKVRNLPPHNMTCSLDTENSALNITCSAVKGHTHRERERQWWWVWAENLYLAVWSSWISSLLACECRKESGDITSAHLSTCDALPRCLHDDPKKSYSMRSWKHRRRVFKSRLYSHSELSRNMPPEVTKKPQNIRKQVGEKNTPIVYFDVVQSCVF